MLFSKNLWAGAALVLAISLGAAHAQTEAAPEAAAIEVVDFGLGPTDAKVTLIEYASFTCPHCATFHANVFKNLKADYIDTGKLRFEYREVYFDRPALWAAMIARCGGEMRYFGISEMIFDQQKEWAAGETPTAIVDSLKKIGRAAGLEDAAMDVCLKDEAKAKAMIAHYEKNFTADGIEGTPTLMINGVKHSNMSYDDLKVILDAELVK
jgi:protein-disulfide isomerase